MMTKLLTPQDWRCLRDIRLRALKESPDSFASSYEEESVYSKQDWINRLSGSEWITFIAIHNNDDIGLVIGGPCYNHAGLYALWVAPKARRHGAAKMLISAICDWAKSQGFTKIFLNVADQNVAATAMYDQLGFAPTGETSTMPPPRTHIVEHQRMKEL